jgi:peptide/nickel transport system substrate-binding protein
MSSNKETDRHTVESTPKTRRRELLAALGMTLSSGCIEEARSLVSRDSPSQISFSIKTLPADADPRSIRIAQFLARQLRTVGIAAEVVPMGRVELWRDILLNQSFDCYVGQHPGIDDPDELRTLLHSRFDAETGWQNPFGYANLGVDDLLTAQRKQSGKKRTKTLRKLQRTIARDQPFSVVGFPDEIRATRTDDFNGWARYETVHSLFGYLSIRTKADGEPLRMTIQDSEPTVNLNPLAVEFRSDETILDLLYDSLGRRIDGGVRPWLARSWKWHSATDTPTATVRLRDELWWHDGKPLTAEDVTFTYKFLGDTSLGSLESPVPAPRFRDSISVVKSARAIDERTVRIEFERANRDVTTKAFSTPVLPKHIWKSKHEQAEIAGFGGDSTTTEALVWSNMEAVGSGPLQFSDAKAKESLTFKRFDHHFLRHLDTGAGKLDANANSTSEPEYIRRYAGGPEFEELQFHVVPSGAAAAELVLNDEADGTATDVTANQVRNIGRAENVQLHVDTSPSMYHVGFNVRKAPFSNVRFRRAVARLLDKSYLIDDVFHQYAEPAASPLAKHDSCAPELQWNGTDPELPFPGEGGTLDVGKAKKAFRNAGYRYTSGGELLQR